MTGAERNVNPIGLIKGAMSADISVDKTIFMIQAGLFVASYGVLRALVFGPYTELLKAREERSSLLKAKALKQQEEAAKKREEYEYFMKVERRANQIWIEEERKQIAEDQRRTIQAARDAANVRLEKTRGHLNEEMAAIRKALAPKMGEIASQLASAILGKKVVVSSASNGHQRKEASLS